MRVGLCSTADQHGDDALPYVGAWGVERDGAALFWPRWLQRPKPAAPPLPDTPQDETTWLPDPKA